MIPRRILFVGDSLTYVNDLPARVRLLATIAGHEVEIEQCVKGGAPLKKLWQKTKVKQVIPRGTEARGEPWDAVVVQEDLPETTTDVFHTFADKFVETIAPTGARTIFFAAWPYPRLPEYDTEAIAAAHDEAAARCVAAKGGSVTVAHAGRAWHRVQEKIGPGLQLYADDDEHPSPVGTAVAAAVIYGVLFGESAPVLPVEAGDTGPGMTEGETLDVLHEIAWALASKSLPEESA